MLELNVLGSPQIRLGTASVTLRPRRLLFLTYLALEGPVDRGELAARFWEGLDPEDGRSRLRLELHRILHSPLAGSLSVSGETVQLTAVCDACRVQQAHAAGQWSEVIRLVRGDLLANLNLETPVQSWLEMQREAFDRLTRDALKKSVEAADQRGDAEEALALERRLLDLTPYSEALGHSVATRLRQGGRLKEAARVESQVRERRQRELGQRPLSAPQHLPSAGSFAAAPSSPIPRVNTPPLVGREALWKQLEAWQQSPAQMVALIGEAGVGKSRLVAEWQQPHGPALVLRGVELGQGVPYYALGDAIHRIPADRLNALAPVWRGELASLWPDVFGDAPSVRPSTSLRLLEALSEALRSAADGCQLIVLEDLHWFDTASLQAISHALRRWGLAEAAPKVMMTLRPGELAEQATLLGWLTELERAGSLRRLEVPPLSEVAVLSLIRQLSGSTHATGFARRLHALSGGNAYALLAFLQGLEDQGVLSRPLGAPWALSVDLEALEQYLTSSLRETLCVALERHGKATLRWMEAAALLTAPFDFEAAQAGSGLKEDDGLAALELAVSHRWLVPAEVRGYRFGHDLLRHALHGQLRPERARGVHRRLAKHLKRAGATSAQRAHHLEQAGERAQAYPLWRDAAKLAEQHWAHREALAFLKRALACSDEPREHLEVYFQRCFHHRSLHALERWDDDLDAVVALLDAHPENAALQAERLRYIHQRTHLLCHLQRLEDALALSEAWVQGELTDARIALLHDRAVVFSDLAQPLQAAQLLEDLLERLEPGRTLAAANLYNTLAPVTYDCGNAAQALEYVTKAIQLFEQVNVQEGLAAAYGNQAAIQEAMGNAVGQKASLACALAHAAQAGNVQLQRYCLGALCELLLASREWPEGIYYATQGLELCESEVDLVGLQRFGDLLDKFRLLR